MEPYNKFRNKDLGPGGYKCYCCRPAPKHRKPYRLRVRRTFKAAFHRELSKELANA